MSLHKTLRCTKLKNTCIYNVINDSFCNFVNIIFTHNELLDLCKYSIESIGNYQIKVGKTKFIFEPNLR